MYFVFCTIHLPLICIISFKPLTVKSSHSDLGILVDSSLKFHLHADFVVAKTMRKAHYILKSFSHLSPQLFCALYKIFLRPTLEYCGQIGRPCYSTFLNRLESCQRRLTKWCKQLRHLPYEDRLLALNLSTFQKRLLRGDVLFTYQILNQLNDLKPSDFFCFATTNTRGHSFKLTGTNCKLNIRHRFFTERVVPLWNSLPAAIISAPTLNSFKKHLDHYL